MYKEDSETAIDLRLIRVWLKASKAMYDVIVQDIDRHGLSVENFMVLEFLYNKGPHTIQKISNQLSIASGSITYVVNRLEEKGYVKREQSPLDRRSSQVVLTQNGVQMFKRIFPEHVEVLSEMVNTLSNEEKVQVTELLKKLGLGVNKLT